MKLRALLSLFAIFLAGFFAVVSCTPSQRPNSTISPASVQAPSPIRLGFSNWPSYLNWQVAQEEEIFAANNLEVDLKFYNYEKSLEAMANGELDANLQALSDTIIAIAKGSSSEPVIILFTDASHGGDAIVVRQGINKISDLKGKKIATQKGFTDHFLLLLGLQKAGIKQGEIQLIDLDPRATVATFVEGQVDAAGLYLPYMNEALKRPGSKILFSSKDFPNAIPSHIVVTRQLIEERPEDVQSLVNTWFDTLDYIRKNPEKAYKIMADYMGVSVQEFKQYNAAIRFISLEENLKAFQNSTPNSFPYRAQQISRFLAEAGTIEKQPDLSNIFDSRFVKAYAEIEK